MRDPHYGQMSFKTVKNPRNSTLLAVEKFSTVKNVELLGLYPVRTSCTQLYNLYRYYSTSRTPLVSTHIWIFEYIFFMTCVALDSKCEVAGTIQSRG